MRSTYAVRRPVVNTYLVRERDRRRWRELALVVVAGVSIGSGLFGYTWIHLEMLRTGYHIDQLERGLVDLTRKERQLQLEAAYLGSPQQIERRAVDELKMQAPALEQVVFWEELP